MQYLFIATIPIATTEIGYEAWYYGICSVESGGLTVYIIMPHSPSFSIRWKNDDVIQ